MARPATGQVVYDTRRKQPVYGLRFRAYGQRRYITLGSSDEGWSWQKAEIELENVLADVRRGIWQPPSPAPTVEAPNDPTFHEFASRWFESNKDGWRENTRLDYAWQLSNHLLPFFKDHRLSAITVAEVDRYRAAKLRQAARLAKAREVWRKRIDVETDPHRQRALRRERPGQLSAESINKTITRLAQIMEVAVEYGMIERNPARGKRRRVKAPKPPAIWLDRAQHIQALLDAARELDGQARSDRRHVPRHALLCTLVFAGLRIGELCTLRWRDVDLAGGRLRTGSKTDAGFRTVDILPVLRDALGALKAQRRPSPDDLVFATASGATPNPSNIRSRILAPAVELANGRLQEIGEVPLPEGVTPHKLRHTYASLLVALGTDPGATMDQLGHTDAAFTLRVYRHGMRRDADSKRALRTLVGLDQSDEDARSAAVLAS